MRVLFFGCDGTPGHGFYGPGLSRVSWRHELREHFPRLFARFTFEIVPPSAVGDGTREEGR